MRSNLRDVLVVITLFIAALKLDGVVKFRWLLVFAPLWSFYLLALSFKIASHLAVIIASKSIARNLKNRKSV